MKKTIALLASLAIGVIAANAQTKIKDGTVTGSSTLPNNASILELESSNKGLLLTRVSLNSTTSWGLNGSAINGTVVYNTNASITGTGGAPVINGGIGVYYWNGSQWVGATAAVEPWYSTQTNTGSLSNTDSVYIMGKIGVGTATPKTQVSLAGTSLAAKTISINDTPVVYLPTQGLNAGQFGGSIAFGNGLRSLTSSTTDDAKYNTATGIGAMLSTTTGGANTAGGYYALGFNTTGSGNTAFGYGALVTNTASNYNTAIGTQALGYNNGGQYNTALGYLSLLNNTTGNYNTSSGYGALSNNTQGSNNTVAGHNAMQFNTTGNSNTALGTGALYALAGGDNNTAVGNNAASALTSGSNNIVIGNNAQPSAVNISSEVTVGNSDNNSYRMFAASWTNASDKRLKHDIENISVGLDFIEKLRPTQYIYNNAYNEELTLGFIAQDVQNVVKQYPSLSKSNLVSVIDNKNELLGLRTTELLPIAIKAIQEQQKEIEDLKTENAKLSATVALLKETNDDMDALAKAVRQLQEKAGITTQKNRSDITLNNNK